MYRGYDLISRLLRKFVEELGHGRDDVEGAAETRSRDRASESRIWWGVFAHTEGRGSSFQCSIQSLTSSSRARAEVWVPR